MRRSGKHKVCSLIAPPTCSSIGSSRGMVATLHPAVVCRRSRSRPAAPDLIRRVPRLARRRNNAQNQETETFQTWNSTETRETQRNAPRVTWRNGGAAALVHESIGLCALSHMYPLLPSSPGEKTHGIEHRSLWRKEADARITFCDDSVYLWLVNVTLRGGLLHPQKITFR